MGVAQYYFHKKMTSARKSRVPFAHTIASFRRSLRYLFREILSSFREHHSDLSRAVFRPAVVVLYKIFHMCFSGDAHIKDSRQRATGAELNLRVTGKRHLTNCEPSPIKLHSACPEGVMLARIREWKEHGS